MQRVDMTAIKPPWKTLRVYHISPMAAAGNDLTYATVSSHLLETITRVTLTAMCAPNGQLKEGGVFGFWVMHRSRPIINPTS